MKAIIIILSIVLISCGGGGGGDPFAFIYDEEEYTPIVPSKGTPPVIEEIFIFRAFAANPYREILTTANLLSNIQIYFCVEDTEKDAINLIETAYKSPDYIHPFQSTVYTFEMDENPQCFISNPILITNPVGQYQLDYVLEDANGNESVEATLLLRIY